MESYDQIRFRIADNYYNFKSTIIILFLLFIVMYSELEYRRFQLYIFQSI